MTLNKEREEYNLVSYKELEKIFIQCEKNSQLNKEFSIDKNIEINSQIKLPVILNKAVRSRLPIACPSKSLSVLNLY